MPCEPGAMLWEAALYNNGSYPAKRARFGESYSMQGVPQRVQTVPGDLFTPGFDRRKIIPEPVKGFSRRLGLGVILLPRIIAEYPEFFPVQVFHPAFNRHFPV